MRGAGWCYIYTWHGANAWPEPHHLAIAASKHLPDARLLAREPVLRQRLAEFAPPLGPLVAGLLLEAVSARATIAVFAAFGFALAVWGTLSPSIRAAPSLDELAELPPPAPGF